MRGEESDEPLSEFMKKEKRNVKVGKPNSKKKKEDKKETRTKGVDSRKETEVEKKKSRKKGKKYEAPVTSNHPRVEGEIISKLPSETIEGRKCGLRGSLVSWPHVDLRVRYDSRENIDSETKDEDATKSSRVQIDFYDAMDEVTVDIGGPAQPAAKKKFGQSIKAKKVDPSSTIPDSDLIHLQIELIRPRTQSKCPSPRDSPEHKHNPPAPPIP
ncbi:hypothetical protein Dimus_036119 [Dionaea muscipula]